MPGGILFLGVDNFMAKCVDAWLNRVYYGYKWYRVVQSGESRDDRSRGEPLIFF